MVNPNTVNSTDNDNGVVDKENRIEISDKSKYFLKFSQGV